MTYMLFYLLLVFIIIIIVSYLNVSCSGTISSVVKERANLSAIIYL